MARDKTARTRIRQYLATAGPLEEPSGHATGALKDAIDYQGSAVAFIQLIAAMDRDGEIDRDIRGKRTYRISAAGDTSAAAFAPYPLGQSTMRVAAPLVAGGEGVVEIDYNRLAKALVSELLGYVAGENAPAPVAQGDAEHDRLAAERDEYARRLEVAREKLDELLGGDVETHTPQTVTTTA